MAVLNSWQKPSRVISTDFGDGSDGDLTISSDTTQSVPNQSCSGTSGNKTLTIAAADSFADDDIVLIQQARGTTEGVGQWEINQIDSGGGTTTLTLKENKQNTYTDSGDGQAQIIKLPQYNNITVDSTKTWSGTSWNQNVGGMLVALAKGTITITGNINVAEKGYRGGSGRTAGSGSGNYGELGENEDADKKQRSDRQNEFSSGGGGDSQNPNNLNGEQGGGAGHASLGNDGCRAGGGAGGEKGDTNTGTSADLSKIAFGAGGGGGGASSSNAGGAGGKGGGICFLFGKIITVSGGISSNGATGVAGVLASGGYSGGGGGGAGGSILLVGDEVTLGSSIVTSSGGAGGTSNCSGGGAAVGRVAVHYKTSVSGTSSPASTNTQDSTLIVPSGFTPKIMLIN